MAAAAAVENGCDEANAEDGDEGDDDVGKGVGARAVFAHCAFWCGFVVDRRRVGIKAIAGKSCFFWCEGCCIYI